MFRELIASSSYGEQILEVVEFFALAIELLAVLIIVVSIFIAMARYSYRGILQQDQEDRYRELKVHLGKALLLGLEILVAADVIRTVALEATLQSVAVLGLLVLIRTFLSWALIVEIEGRWPWQPERGEE
jgi:uncharacterized membrane protein